MIGVADMALVGLLVFVAMATWEQFDLISAPGFSWRKVGAYILMGALFSLFLAVLVMLTWRLS